MTLYSRVSLPQQLSRVLFLISIAVIISCKSDTQQVNTQTAPVIANLDGKWAMSKAYKGNKQSDMLNKGYFVIENGTIKTNILGDETAYPYVLDGQRIRVKDDAKTIFHVTKKTEDSLIMTAKLRNFNFKFITVKTIDETIE